MSNRKDRLGGSNDPVRKKSKTKKPATTADNYIAKELAAPGQEYDGDKVKAAKRILDENLNYLSKDCYMKLNQDVIQNRNPETIRVLLAFRNPHSVDLLVRNCMLLYNEQEYSRLINR